MATTTRDCLDLYVYVRFNQLLIKLRGDFNVTALSTFVSRMRYLKEHYNKQIVLDAKYLNSIDSIGIRTLINFTRIVRIKPAIYHIKDDIMDVLQTTGIPFVIDIYKTERDFNKYN